MKQPDTTQPCYLGACDVAAVAGIVKSELEKCDLPYRTRANLERTLAVIAHAQRPSPPLTQERIAELGKEWGKDWGKTP